MGRDVGPSDQGHESSSVDVVVATTGQRLRSLRRCVETVLGQNHPGVVRCTVVVDQPGDVEPLGAAQLGLDDVDPGDATASHRELRIIHNVRTGGLAGARNSGIVAATHPLVAFCDDDDEWCAEKLALQIVALRASHSQMCVTGITVIVAGERHERPLPSTEVVVAQLTRGRLTAAHPSSYLFDRLALIGRIGLVDEALPGSYGEDYDLLLRAARTGRVTAVPDPLTVVHWGDSMFATDWDRIAASADHLISRHPELASDRRGHARIRARQAFAHAAAGRPTEAMVSLRLAVWSWPFERRIPLVVLVASGLVRAEFLIALAHRFGRGV